MRSGGVKPKEGGGAKFSTGACVVHDGIWVYEISNEFLVFLCIFLRNSFWKEESFCVEIFQADVQSTKQIIQSKPLMVGKLIFCRCLQFS